MGLADETRADADRRLDRLRDLYGDFPVADVTVENDPAFFAEGRRLAEQGWRGDAGAWVTDEAGRTLLIRHPDGDGSWGTPGGGHEPGETFEETAVREVREETGVDGEVTGVWRARRKEIRHADEPHRRLTMLTVWFDARTTGDGASDAPTAAGDDEVLEARWFTEPPESVAGFLEARVQEWDDGTA